MSTTPLHGWGRHPIIEATTVCSEDLRRAGRGAVLSRGLGRAYGDAALPPEGCTRPVSISTRADRILGFDPSTGLLRAEAGLSLSELARLYLPRGWFSPVSPGTQHVTLGGMVASDIHGKNHHVDGTFGNFVRALVLQLADGTVLEISRDAHSELFAATLGGMGLTGHILEVAVELTPVPSPWIYEESERLGSLREIFAGLQAASDTWPMTVAWIDTSATGASTGRGILMRGRWATASEAPDHPPGPRPSIPVPFTLPSGLLNRATIRLLNTVWYRKHRARARAHVTHPGAFFWQLDMASDWYRVYGRRGFAQYQCVMPRELEIFECFLARFQELGGCSFVTVLKDCGPQGEGLLSFPQAGTSMALDIPITSVEATTALIRQLDAFVLDHGGRVYLAKDAFTSPEAFRRMYPRWEAFEAVRDRYDPQRRLASAQSMRLLGDRPRRQVASQRSESEAPRAIKAGSPTATVNTV
ncbi:MAG TPA: FAD-binding oxidoreductase [Deltaproteobacteria bacterium]|nr:FAD-binding oxidoreductase [Deltaproteobacteria bacterium]